MSIRRPFIASTKIALNRKSTVFDSGYYRGQHPRSIIHAQGDKPSLFAFWARWLARSRTGGTLLDIGCGEGHFLRRAQSSFVSFGLDLSSYGIEQARLTAQDSSFVVADARFLPFRKESVSIITLFDVIEHLDSPGAFLREARLILTQRGLLILTTPNPCSLGAKIKGGDWFGLRDPTHTQIRVPCQWKELLETCGFTVARDGTDAPWDSPYFQLIPAFIQNVLFKALSHFLIWSHGFYPWNLGENYACIAQKQ